MKINTSNTSYNTKIVILRSWRFFKPVRGNFWFFSMGPNKGIHMHFVFNSEVDGESKKSKKKKKKRTSESDETVKAEDVTEEVNEEAKVRSPKKKKSKVAVLDDANSSVIGNGTGDADVSMEASSAKKKKKKKNKGDAADD